MIDCDVPAVDRHRRRVPYPARMAYLDASFNESPQRSPMAFSSPFRPLFGITLLLGLVAGGCSPIIETRGYLPDPAVIARCAGAPKAGVTVAVTLTAADPSTGRVLFTAIDQ